MFARISHKEAESTMKLPVNVKEHQRQRHPRQTMLVQRLCSSILPKRKSRRRGEDGSPDSDERQRTGFRLFGAFTSRSTTNSAETLRTTTSKSSTSLRGTQTHSTTGEKFPGYGVLPKGRLGFLTFKETRAAKRLIRLTEDSTAQAYGFNPLHIACGGGVSPRIVDWMLLQPQYEYFVSETDYSGKLPLHNAVLSICRKLMPFEDGAEIIKMFYAINPKIIHQEDMRGNTAIDTIENWYNAFARAHGEEELAKILTVQNQLRSLLRKMSIDHYRMEKKKAERQKFVHSPIEPNSNERDNMCTELSMIPSPGDAITLNSLCLEQETADLYGDIDYQHK